MNMKLSKSEFIEKSKADSKLGKSSLGQKNTTNFRNNFLLETIYDPDNIKIIIDNPSYQRKSNKVFQAKKNRLQKKIQQVILRKSSAAPREKTKYKHKLARPQTAPKKIQNPHKNEKKYHEYLESDFLLEYDEGLNYRGVILQQSSENLQNNYNRIFAKVNTVGGNPQLNEIKKSINFYLTQVSPKKGKKVIVNTQKVDGYLFDPEWKQKGKKTRPKTSQPIARKFDDDKAQPPTKKSILQKYPMASKKRVRYSRPSSMANLNLKEKNVDQKKRCQQILKTIQDHCRESQGNQMHQRRILKKMSKIWGHGISKQSEEEPSKEFGNILPSTLELLKEKRNQSKGVKNIDKQYLVKK